MRPGYTQTDVTHPVSGWGGANVGLQHLGRIPNCSEVPDTCFLWYFVQFFFFFFVSRRHEQFFLWVHQLSPGISPLAARKNARDLSGGRSGYRLGFIRGPLGISLGIYPVAAREIAWDFSGGCLGDPQAYLV